MNIPPTPVPGTAPNSYVRPPRKPLTLWVLLLPFALLIGGLWQSSRSPEQVGVPEANPQVGHP